VVVPARLSLSCRVHVVFRPPAGEALAETHRAVAAKAPYRDPDLINATRFVGAYSSLNGWVYERLDAASARSLWRKV